MRHLLIQNPFLRIVVICGLMMLPRVQSTTIASPADTTLQTQTAPQWTVVTAFSYSFLNNGYDDWHKESTELYHYLPDARVLLGTSVELEERSRGDSDITYGANARWYAGKTTELHGGFELTQDADFLPGERYTLGMLQRVHPRLELLFELERLEFAGDIAGWEDGITQVEPGFCWRFNDDHRVTLRWAHGWVHDDADYDYYSAKFHLGKLVRDGTVSIGLAYGSDPDFGFGTPTTTLSDAYNFSLFYTEPTDSGLKLIVGLEYTYRMRPDTDGELYQMWTPTFGIACKF